MVTVVVDLLTGIITIDQCEIFRLHLLIGLQYTCIDKHYWKSILKLCFNNFGNTLNTRCILRVAWVMESRL